MHQLVIRFPLENTEPTRGEVDALIELQSQLERSADGEFEVDGNDFGAGEMNIFIITDNAAHTLERIRAALPTDREWHAGFRDLEADDYIPLAPVGLQHFDVK